MCICKLHEDTPLIRTHSGIHNYVYITILCYPFRLACQVNDGQSVSGAPAGLPTSPGEALSKRCVQLLRTSLKPDIWPSKSNVKIVTFYMYIVTLFLSFFQTLILRSHGLPNFLMLSHRLTPPRGIPWLIMPISALHLTF